MDHFACGFQISLLSLQRFRIAGNLRKSRERKTNGRHNFSAALDYVSFASCVVEGFLFWQAVDLIYQNADSIKLVPRDKVIT